MLGTTSPGQRCDRISIADMRTWANGRKHLPGHAQYGSGHRRSSPAWPRPGANGRLTRSKSCSTGSVAAAHHRRPDECRDCPGACGIAYALRFVRAMQQGGIEIGFDWTRRPSLPTKPCRRGNHPAEGSAHAEAEIDKVTTPRAALSPD
ncbi:MAG: hypothetical protein R2787_06975 [Saprospiraceae bacterium]